MHAKLGRRWALTCYALALLLFSAGMPKAMAQSAAAGSRTQPVVVGSKAFTESHLLGAMFVLLIEAHTDLEVLHRSGLGGTLICHEAILSGEIDIYPEYTGTAWTTILKRKERASDPLRTYLGVTQAYRERYDATWLQPLGFNNTYVLAMDRARAIQLGVETLGDLAKCQAKLRAGFSLEFLNRPDGLPGLASFYGIQFDSLRGMEHALAYTALAEGELDLLDAYATDAKLASMDLVRLRDERGFFPPYQAAAVVRNSVLAAHPELRAVLDRLAFRIDDERMAALNLRAESGELGFAAVAREFLLEEGLLEPQAKQSSQESGSSLWHSAKQQAALLGPLALEHLALTGLAMLLAISLGLPLALWLVARPRAARVCLGLASVLQTIPGLALLALMISLPGLGLSKRSAVLALLLYSLLPILRSAHVGLTGIDPRLIDAARGMGLLERQILIRIRMPLAVPSILGGIRTSAVICIGLATLAAFIGAGGLGEAILTGLYLNQPKRILGGALAAAGLALVLDGSLAMIQKWLTPRGLRQTENPQAAPIDQ